MKLLALAAILWLGGMASAQGQECKPLRMLNSVPLEMRGAQILVPVTINGTSQKMLLDTGGVTSQISENFARDAKLRLRDSHLRLISVNGKASEKEAKLDEFVLGRLKATDTAFQITPLPFRDLAGILALNFFLAYDVDLDFAAAKLNFISPDHCEGQVVYWPASAVTSVPIRVKDGHITVQVTLDDHPLEAIIDTGASQTTMSMETAHTIFHLTADGPDMVSLGTVNGDPGLKSYGHIFTSLGFGGVAVRNPHII